MISLITLLVEFCVLGVLNNISGGTIPVSIYTICIIIESVAIIATFSNNKVLSNYQLPLTIAYFWRVFLVYFDIYGRNIFKLPNSGADSTMYYSTAVNYISTGDPGRGEMFSRVMGTIFSITGASRVYGQYMIMLFSMISLCVLASIIFRLDIDDFVKLRTVALVGLLPNFAILSSIFLRESIVTMFISLSLYCFYIWTTDGNEIPFAFAFIFIIIASSFHSGSIAVGIGYVAVRLLYDKKHQIFRLSIMNILTTAVFVLIIAFLYLNYGDMLFEKMMDVSTLSDVAATSTEGGSSYAAYVGNSNTIFNMIIFTIPRIVYFLFSPFPWQWRGLSDIIAFVFSSLFYMLTIKKAIQFMNSSEKNNRNLVFMFMIIAFCTVFVFAWGVSNTGTAARHRDKMIILFGIIYALCSNERNTRFPIVAINQKRIL